MLVGGGGEVLVQVTQYICILTEGSDSLSLAKLSSSQSLDNTSDTQCSWTLRNLWSQNEVSVRLGTGSCRLWHIISKMRAAAVYY
jgi:hypothetical protein